MSFSEDFFDKIVAVNWGNTGLLVVVFQSKWVDNGGGTGNPYNPSVQIAGVGTFGLFDSPPSLSNIVSGKTLYEKRTDVKHTVITDYYHVQGVSGSGAFDTWLTFISSDATLYAYAGQCTNQSAPDPYNYITRTVYLGSIDYSQWAQQQQAQGYTLTIEGHWGSFTQHSTDTTDIKNAFVVVDLGKAKARARNSQFGLRFHTGSMPSTTNGVYTWTGTFLSFKKTPPGGFTVDSTNTPSGSWSSSAASGDQQTDSSGNDKLVTCYVDYKTLAVSSSQA